MAGIDYKSASVSVREPFSLTASAVKDTVMHIREQEGVEGCVLLSTCNRTELYLSCTDDHEQHPALLLCSALELPASYVRLFFTRKEQQAISHLMMVSTGLRSQIRGEYQILTQVKTAVDISRESQCTDAVLESLFRCAISAGKKAKTLVPLSPMETSTAHRAIEVLQEHIGSLSGKSALVIGNGEMGRLTASMLVEKGCQVTMTVRSYKRGEVVIPTGCDKISYDDRYKRIPDCDFVVSATASPHFTLHKNDLQKLDRLPHYFVDLAVPRDIEPDIAAWPGVVCWNVDTLGSGTPSKETAAKLLSIKQIIKEYITRFQDWKSYRALLLVSNNQSC